jgi:O-antigen/teichoic acid export membrane protein
MIQNITAKIRGDQNLKNLLKHSGVMYASGAVSTVLLIIQQITTAKIIGPSDYGRLATVLGSSLLVMYIMDVRTWEAGVKLLARPIIDGDKDEVTRIITWLTLADVVTGILGSLVVILFAQFIAVRLLQAPDLYWLVSLYALMIPFRMLSNGIARTSVRMYNRFDWLSVKSIVYGLSRIVFMSGAALLGYGLQGVVIGAIIVEIISAIVIVGMQWRIQKRELTDKTLFDFRKPQQFKIGLKMMRGVWLSATLQGLQIEVFVPILALLTVPAQVGLFRSGLDIAETIEKLSVPLMTVLFPQVIKSYEQDSRVNFIRLIKQSSILMGMLTLPFTLGIIFIGPVVFPRLLGKDFDGIAIVATILVIGFAIYGIFMWTRPALIAFNRLSELNLICAATIVLSVIALVIFVPTYGAVGAVIIHAGAIIFQNVLLLVLFRNVLPQQHFPAQQTE